MSFSTVADHLPDIVAGTLRTLEITTFAFLVALVVGIPLAALMSLRPALLRGFSGFLLLMLRGLPELVALYLLYYGFGSRGISMGPVVAACIALGVIQAAFVAEIYGASLRTIAQGQREAAAAIGLRGWQQWRLVLAPQALRFSVPPLVNVYLALLKLSVLASAIGAGELLFEAQSIMNESFDILPIALVVVGIFLAITLPLTWMTRRLERRLRIGQVAR